MRGAGLYTSGYGNTLRWSGKQGSGASDERKKEGRSGTLLFLLFSFTGPFGGLFPFAADILPTGQSIQQPGHVGHSGGDVDILGTHAAALAAVQAGLGPLLRGQGFHAHPHAEGGFHQQIVVVGQQIGDVQADGQDTLCLLGYLYYHNRILSYLLQAHYL